MAPTTQKALILPYPKAEWTITEVAVPTPGPKDVLVKVVAAGLNPADWKIQVLGLNMVQYPFTGGDDAAGIVEEVGAEVTNVAKGDKVLYPGWFAPGRGTFQHYSLVQADFVAKIPENISFEQAASVPLGLNTVVLGLYNQVPGSKSLGYPAPWTAGGATKFAGKPAFILGGSSSVGQYAIQLAKLSGFSPIITTASLRNADLLKSLGATHVVDRALPPTDVQAEVSTITAGKPVSFVFDAISHEDTQLLAYDVLAPGGDLVIVNPEAIPEEKKKAAGGSKRVLNVFADIVAPENRELLAALYSRLTDWLATGKLVPNRVEVLPNGLAGIPDGLERMKENKVSGTKLIAHPQETL